MQLLCCLHRPTSVDLHSSALIKSSSSNTFWRLQGRDQSELTRLPANASLIADTQCCHRRIMTPCRGVFPLAGFQNIGCTNAAHAVRALMLIWSVLESPAEDVGIRGAELCCRCFALCCLVFLSWQKAHLCCSVARFCSSNASALESVSIEAALVFSFIEI